MAERLLRKKPRKVAPKKPPAEERRECALVGTCKVNIVNLVLSEEPYSDYSKTCEALEI